MMLPQFSARTVACRRKP